MVELTRQEEERALELHKRAIIIDGNNASVMDSEYLRKMLQAGVTATKRTVARSASDFRQIIGEIQEWYQKIDEDSKVVVLVSTVDDIVRAKHEGKTAITFGFDDAIHIQADLNLLRIFNRLGIKTIQLTYNDRNLLGDGCAVKENRGLSRLGVQVVEEMNKLGIVVDLAHCGDATTMNAIEVSKDPVVVSHANARRLCNNARNKTDEQIQALSGKDGVIGVIAFPGFVKENWKPTIEDLLNHIDYIVDLVGVDHVGIGLDLVEGKSYESLEYFVQKWPEAYRPLPWQYAVKDISDSLSITKGLVARRYSDREIEKILGGNFLRVFKRVWKQ